MLLILEDEISLLRYLEDNFKRAGYCVLGLSQIEELEAFLTVPSNQPSILILDRMVDLIDTASYIARVKTQFPSCKVLVLSAIGGPHEKGKILDLGADDYVSKPFSLEELSARVRVLLRHHNQVASPSVKLGNLQLNLVNQTVECQGNRVQLPRKEFQLLRILMESPTRVFNRYQLLDLVWDINTGVETNVVEVTVRNLRKKLEELGASIRLLSKRFTGYWLEV